MENSILDVNFTDDELKKCRCRRECIGNINDIFEKRYDEQEDEIKITYKETEEGLTITFIDNNDSSFQK